MLDEDWLVFRHAKDGALGVGGTNEFGRGDVCGRDALLFKVDNIVRTARNAGPSITEGFNDCVTFLPQFNPDGLRRRACHRWLHASQHIFDAILLA